MANPDVSSTTPVNAPLERSIYVGVIFSGILYGVEVFTFFAAVYCISHRSSTYRRRQKFYIVYGGALLVLVTVELGSVALLGQYMWIDHRDYPGGPLGYLVASQSLWYDISGPAASAMANILGDGLLVYRCYIIWDSRWNILALPVLAYLTSSVLSIISVVETALVQPHLSTTNRNAAHFGVLWVSLSVGLNVIVTFMICFRLLRMRALTRLALSPEMSSMYTSVAAMLIESAAPFSILGIGLVITGVQNTPPLFAFSFIWGMFCSLSPQMIILRVAMGRGWSKETVNEISTALVFAKPPTVHDQSQGARMTIYNTNGHVFGPGMPENRSDMSIEKRASKTGIASRA